MRLYALPHSGVMYFNEYGAFVIRDKKLVNYQVRQTELNFIIRENEDGSLLNLGPTNRPTATGKYELTTIQIRNAKAIDSAVLLRFPSINPIPQNHPALDDQIFICLMVPKKNALFFRTCR